MAKSQITQNKKEKEKKRLKKRLDKEAKREERRSSQKGGGLDSMIAYVDENGMITDTPPDPANKTKIDASTIEVSVPRKEKETTPTEFRGKLEYFDDSRGFGFIRNLDTQEKYFVHITEMLGEIKENDIVTFELERGMKGMNAVRVKKAV